MPLYDYACANGHRSEYLVRFETRDAFRVCVCGEPMTRQLSAPHCVPDGMYSYAPNLGSEAAFARRLDAVKNGEKIIKKE